MHANDRYEGRRLCVSVEIVMDLTFEHNSSLNRREQGATQVRTMLSGAHHLGALMDSGACRGTPYAVTVHAENLLFLTIF